MLIFGIIAAAVGGLMLWGSVSAQRKVYALRTAERRSCGSLRELFTQITAEIGPGSMYEQCELVGTAECSAPLNAEISGEPCIYYEIRVERKYEETQKKNGTQSVEHRSETVAHNEQHAEFQLTDSSGSVTVVPEGATFEARKSVDRFEPSSGGEGLAVTIGNFSLTLPVGLDRRRTVGYKITEHLIPLSSRLYILGEASDRDGELVIKKPREGELIISLKSKDELVAASASRARWMRIGGAIFAAGGAAMSVVSLFR